MSSKYPRTYHLPWSPGVGSDDKVIETVDYLLNTPLIFTDKLDGSNMCFNNKDIFARTHSGPPIHESFNIAKSIHASLKHKLTEGLDFFGEYCYAKHSIAYSELPGYFFLFGIRDNSVHPDIGFWKSWSFVKSYAKELNIPTVPELEKIKVSSAKELQKEVEKYMGSPCSYGEREGVVVRRAEGFSDRDFSKVVCKIVRKNHITTSKHWKNEQIISNKLKQ